MTDKKDPTSKGFQSEGVEMARSRTVLTAVFACMLLVCACGSEPPAMVRQITVTGSGIAQADPDIATVVLGVDVTSEDPAEAVTEAATLINSTVEAAQEMGVAEEDMSTQSYSLWIEDVYDPVTYQYTGEKIYHVSQYESIVVRDLASVGDVLAGLVGAGANTISSVSFGIEDQATLLEQARVAALGDAVDRAESLAAGLGVDVGEPVYVSEYSSGYAVYDQMAACGETVSGDLFRGPSITPGSFSISASVTVTFEIE
jgi:hypothetical protein